jgi:hypothetical protein
MSLLERFDQVMQKAADSMQHDEEVYPPANGEAAHVFTPAHLHHVV